ncbi:nucleolar transcription factor 1-like [Apostichopus japonicus]|uniref:nucleolar transcription factor 1-like n=1 Tax=Stichopus japonicus TaxID=307972 RepID=UPI003AB20E8A
MILRWVFHLAVWNIFLFNKILHCLSPDTHFKMEDRLTLVSNLFKQFPTRDTGFYKSTISKVKWEMVAFHQFTPEECQQEWELIQADIQKYKTATQIAKEALVMVNSPTYIPKRSAHGTPPTKTVQ